VVCRRVPSSSTPETRAALKLRKPNITILC
jgi:hypothetical protein